MAITLERYQDACPHYYITLTELQELFCLSSPLYWGCQHRLKIIIKNGDCISYRRFCHDFDVYGLDISGHQQILRKLCLLHNLCHLRLRDLCLNGFSYGILTELALINCSHVSMSVISEVVTLRTLIIRNIKIDLKLLPPYLTYVDSDECGVEKSEGD